MTFGADGPFFLTPVMLGVFDPSQSQETKENKWVGAFSVSIFSLVSVAAVAMFHPFRRE